MILRNPTTGPRIVPFGEARTSADVLPNGHLGFRVTQRFADVNPDFPQFGRHGALDLGNSNCEDVLLAAVAGVVSNLRDIHGALITEIRAGSGDVVGYGHLRTFLKPHGSVVTIGQAIGLVGDTGLGAVCHCHFYHRNASGVLVDPWPELEQNVVAASLGYVRFNRTVDGVNLRRGPNATKDNVYAIAFADSDPKPNGIRRTHGSQERIGATSTRRKLLGIAAGPNGERYFRFKVNDAHPELYCNTNFMYRRSS